MYNDSGVRALLYYVTAGGLIYVGFLYTFNSLVGIIAALVAAGILGYIWSHLRDTNSKRKKRDYRDDEP